MSVESPDTSKSNPLDMDFAGWGDTEDIESIEPSQSSDVALLDHEKKHFLGEWLATAICGNDITSSCLYVSALTIAVSGIYAPLALLMVSMTLYLFRKIYSEVGSALPMNGKKYYEAGSAAAEKIAEENRVSFKTAEEAEAAGYSA
jgi:hypothetical protein